MRYAIIKNGVVENIAVTDNPDFAAEQGWVLATDEADMGMLYQGGQFLPPPADVDKLASDARSKRNALLLASDRTQLADAPFDQTAWAVYRQALRDITIQSGFPETINWPVAPQ